MKIRIKGDSIRFRLTKTEVETLCKIGYVEEITHLGPQLFKYAVQRKRIESMDIRYEDCTILMDISDKKIHGWASNETVGFETSVVVNNNSVHLLLEKDFVCLDERVEDQSDNYPNPRMLSDK